MKTSVCLMALAIATALAAAEDSIKARDTLHRLITKEWPSAAMSGDADKYVKFLTDDMVYMPPNQDAITDKNVLREWLAQIFLTARFQIKIHEPEEIVITGEWAFARYRVEVWGTTTSGDKLTFDRKYIDIWRRVGDSWKCHRHIWNDNVPPAVEKLTRRQSQLRPLSRAVL